MLRGCVFGIVGLLRMDTGMNRFLTWLAGCWAILRSPPTPYEEPIYQDDWKDWIW